jgi:bifunctional non-homologous end joining protein LigD
MPVVDGHSITITHPDKVLFPEDGITKADLAEYYERIADRMVPLVRNRPLHMNRYPDGIGGILIQQKRIPDSFPKWIERVTVEKKGGTVTHAMINDAATLVYLANYNMITAHIWLSRAPAIDEPDQIIFDLDPGDTNFTLVRQTALKLRTALEKLGLNAFVKTTGSRGLHVVVPITVGPKFEEAHLFADYLAQQLAANDPDHLTTEFLKEKRQGRLFLDVNRNAYAQTVVAPYAVRARNGAPVAVPLSWASVEREDLRPDSVTIRNAFDWLGRHEDPWAEMERVRRPLPELSESQRPDRSGRRKGVSRTSSSSATPTRKGGA